jgi:trehalose 6-phosphate phosphatase
VHVRGAADPPAAAARLRGPLATIAAAAGLRFLEGKHVLELTPTGSDKGLVVRRLAEGAGAVAFAGDDLADLAAFEEVARQAGSGLATCTIAVGGLETPQEVLAAADLVVEGPEGLLDLLASL